MSPSTHPRGPLPARVYWFRRAIVLGVPLLLVIVLARVLTGSSDGQDGDVARQASARPSEPAGSVSAPALGPTAPAATGKKAKLGKSAKPPEPVLAEPSGPCADDDVLVTPTITSAPGGSDVPIILNLRTLVSEACMWQASADSLTVTITSGEDHIWSSRECPASILAQDVVVRRDVDTPVQITWSARRSDETCSKLTKWAMPGWYHIESAALAGEPTDVQFELVAPASAVITKTVTPTPEGGKKGAKGEKYEHQAGDDGGGNSVG